MNDETKKRLKDGMAHLAEMAAENALPHMCNARDLLNLAIEAMNEGCGRSLIHGLLARACHEINAATDSLSAAGNSRDGALIDS